MNKKWKTLLWLVLAAGFLWGLKALPFREWLMPLLDRLESAGWIGQVLYVLVGGLLVMLFVPASVLVVSAGFLFGFGRGLLLAMGVLCMGSIGGYLTGGLLWRRLRHLKAFQGRKLTAVREAIEQEGLWMIALLRVVPFLHFMSSNLFFGSLTLPFASYTLWSMLGMLPGTALMVYGGSLANTTLDSEAGLSVFQIAMLAAGFVAFGLISWRLTVRTRALLSGHQDNDKSTSSAR